MIWLIIELRNGQLLWINNTDTKKEETTMFKNEKVATVGYRLKLFSDIDDTNSILDYE